MMTLVEPHLRRSHRVATVYSYMDAGRPAPLQGDLTRMTFRPKFVTFDCYGTLTNYDMAGAARRVYGAQLSEPAMSAFIKHFAGYRRGSATMST
jgi:hypothetical protein